MLAGVMSSSAQGERQEWICRSANTLFLRAQSGSPEQASQLERDAEALEKFRKKFEKQKARAEAKAAKKAARKKSGQKKQLQP